MEGLPLFHLRPSYWMQLITAQQKVEVQRQTVSLKAFLKTEYVNISSNMIGV